MQRALVIFLPLALVACSPARYNDIAGPFTGVTYRFAVDGLTLPLQRSDFADDLNGDKRTDDQLGNIGGTLLSDRDLTDAAGDMLASGALRPVVEITTDDPALRNDPTVGIVFRGADGERADQMGGSLDDGHLVSNPTRLTRLPASATLHLPLYENADPLVVPAIGLEIELTADGHGGFDAILRGGFPATEDTQPAWSGLVQMIAANPQEFPSLITLFDTDRDGTVSLDEFAHNGLIENVMAPDIQLTDGSGGWAPNPDNTTKDSLSFGVALHLVPCASGACQAPPADLCHDRVRDGDETDVDCGGSCLACPGDAACSGDADCQSHQCSAGRCQPPSCSDGLQDGHEIGVDCGYVCPGCPDGNACNLDRDCASGFCNGGTCGETMCHDFVKDLDESGVDCGGHCPGCPQGGFCHSDGDCASGHCSCANSLGCTGVCK